MNDFRQEVLRMLAAAGNPVDVLAECAGLTGPERTATFAVPHVWGTHRHRWELALCLNLLDRTGTGCWYTTGARSTTGGATCSRKSLGTTLLARQVFMIVHDRYDLIERPDLVVRHICGQGSQGCARPDHLVLGTRADNGADRRRHRLGHHVAGADPATLRHMDVLDWSEHDLRALTQLEACLHRLRTVGDGCLAVDGSEAAHYRTVRIGRHRNHPLHRYVLEQVLGRPLHPGMQAQHGCDRKQCCAVGHLSEGPPAKNTRDAYERGLLGAGERHPRATLLGGMSGRVRDLSDGGWGTRRIADEFGLPIKSVWNAARRATYTQGTGETRRPAKVYLSDRGVRSCRVLAALGADLDGLQTRTGLGRGYLADLLCHGQRAGAGGPLLPPAGRARGAQVATARLDPLRVAVAKQLVFDGGMSRAAVARLMAVHPSTIERAVAEEGTWRP